MSGQEIPLNTFKSIIISWGNTLDSSKILSKLSEHNYTISDFYHTLSMEVIKETRSYMSDPKDQLSDITFCSWMIPYFQIIRNFSPSPLPAIDFNKCKQIVENSVKILKNIIEKTKGNYSKNIEIVTPITNLLFNIFELYKPEVANLVFSRELHKIIFENLSLIYEIRSLIYKVYRYTIENNVDSLENWKDLKYKTYMNKVINSIWLTYSDQFLKTSNEIIEIAMLFVDDISIVYNKYLSAIWCIFHNADRIPKGNICSIYDIWISMIFNNKNDYRADFANWILDNYEKEIHTKQGIDEIIMECWFKQLTIEKYDWITNNTNFIKRVILTFPLQKKVKIITAYFNHFWCYCEDKNKCFYFPKMEIINIMNNVSLFIQKKNERGITLILENFKDLLKCNKTVIDVIWNQTNYVNEINLWWDSNNTNTKVKAKNEYQTSTNMLNEFLTFLEYMIVINENYFTFSVYLKLSKDHEFNILQKSISIAWSYEINKDQLERKLGESFEIVLNKLEEGKVKEGINTLNNILISLIKNKNKFTKAFELKIQEGVAENWKTISGLIVNAKRNLELLKEFIDIWFNFTRAINNKLLESLFQPETEAPLTNLNYWINKKQLIDIISILWSNDERDKLYTHIVSKAIERGDGSKGIIISPLIITMLLKYYLMNKGMKELIKLFSCIKSLISYNDINVKMLIKYKLVKYIFKSWLLFTAEKDIAILWEILTISSNYFNKSDLELYLVSSFFHPNLRSKLFSILHSKSLSEGFNYIKLTFSKYPYLNPFIFNMIYFPSLVYKSETCNHWSIYFNIVISSYSNTENFIWSQIKSSLCNISIVIDDSKHWCIFENSCNKRGRIGRIEKIDKIITPGVSHTVWIEWDTSTNELSLFIDHTGLKTIRLESTQFDIFDFSMGFKGCDLKTGSREVSFIDISYWLVVNSQLSKKSRWWDIWTRKRIYSGNGKTLISNYNTNTIVKSIITEVAFSDIKLYDYTKHTQPNVLSILRENYYEETDMPFIPYLKTKNANNPNSEKVTILLISQVNNISSYLANNGLECWRVFDKKTIERKCLDNKYGWIKNDSFFVDFLFGWLYFDSNFSSFNDVMKLILRGDNSENVDYFIEAYHHKLRCMIIENINFVNSNNDSILEDFFAVCDGSDNQMNTLLKKVFVNELLFTSWNETNQKLVLKQLSMWLSNEKENNDSNTLYNICVSLMNIIMYFPWTGSVVEWINSNIFFVFELILKITKVSNLSRMKLINLAHLAINIINNFSGLKESHNLKSIQHKLGSHSLLASEAIANQIQTLSKGWFNVLKHNNILNETSSHNTNSNSNSSSNSNNNSAIKPCDFCTYLVTYFTIYYKHLKELASFTKAKTSKWIEFYLKYKTLRIKFDFQWNWSNKEGYARIRNRFKLKENNIIKLDNTAGKSFIFKFDKNYYQGIRSTWNEIWIYSTIIEYNFINTIINVEEDKETENKFTYVNCWYLKQMKKTVSLWILSESKLYWITNIITDESNGLFIPEYNMPNIYWLKDNYKEELKIYLNGEDLRSSVFKKKSCWNYGNYKIRVKPIKYSEIQEMMKKTYLHVDNMIEWFLKSGENVVWVFNKPRRDEIFDTIISTLNKKYHDIGNVNSIWKECSWYMKHCPMVNKTKKGKKPIDYGENRGKSLIDVKSLWSETCHLWVRHKISTFDYCMFLNTISGRNLNNWSQYFVYPWILQYFFTDKMSVTYHKVYRNFWYPLHAQKEFSRKILSEKYEDKDKSDHFHCGQFYSTSMFTSHFLTRVPPYLACSIEIMDGNMDVSDRCFNSVHQWNNCSIHYEEQIPELYYLHEWYLNINKIDLGTLQDSTKVGNIILPKWAHKDVRWYTNILQVVMENPIVSDNINLWFDLIFGERQSGRDGIEVFNIYRSACYPEDGKSLKKMKDKEIEELYVEKEEYGICPNQIFNKPHPQRLKYGWNYMKTTSFFSSKEKWAALKLVNVNAQIQINNNSIGDVGIVHEVVCNNYYQGGISSISTIMQEWNKDYHNECKNTKNNDEIIYSIVNKGKTWIGPKYKRYMTYSKGNLYIIFPRYNLRFEYYLKQNSNITSLCVNKKGTVVFVGFENGRLGKFKIKNRKNEYIINSGVDNEPTIIITGSNKHTKQQKYESTASIVFPKATFHNGVNSDYVNINLTKCQKSVKDKKQKLHKIWYLLEDLSADSSQCQICSICYNNAFNYIVCADIANTLYWFDCNKMKLLQISSFLSVKAIDAFITRVIPVERSKVGEFVISTQNSVYLFSINAVPWCEWNITECTTNPNANPNPNVNVNSLSPISCVDAACLKEVYVFTSHIDGWLCIWKVSNNTKQDHSNHTFLAEGKEYNYAYDNSYKKGVKYELGRKFEMIKKIDSLKNKDLSITYIKLNNNWSNLVVIDAEWNMNLWLYSDEECKEHSSSTKPKLNKEGFRCCSNCGCLITGAFILDENMNEDVTGRTDDGEEEEEEELYAQSQKDKEKEKEKEKEKNEELKDVFCNSCHTLINSENFMWYGI